MHEVNPERCALSVRGLRVELGGRPVLHDINLHVDRGEILSLIGPNGAGKTTLLRSILQLIPTLEGTVSVLGAGGRQACTNIGYVPQRQEFAWDYPISVADAVMTGATAQIGWFRRPRAEHWRAVREALEQVRMADLADRTVGELSGGQRQRVLIARGLATKPAVLLFDEPFTGLDMPSQELLTELFTELAAGGRALMITTHDLFGALQSSDRVALLNQTIIAQGPPATLTDRQQWMRAFEVSENSPLLKLVGVA